MITHLDKIESTGNGPAARFAHTTTFIQKGKAILFGGIIIQKIYFFPPLISRRYW